MSLSVLLFALAFAAPVVGAALNLFVPDDRPGLMRRIMLVAELVTLACAFLLALQLTFGATIEGPVFGLGGASGALFGTSSLLGLTTVVFSRVLDRPRRYFWIIALMQSGVTGAFTLRILLGFWVSWVVTVVCICLLMSRWGSSRSTRVPKNVAVPVALVLVVMLAAFCLALSQGAVGISGYEGAAPSPRVQLVIAFLLLTAFGATVGVFPLHFWLPDVRERLTAGPALMLDGSLSCMAVYGMVRIVPVLAPAGAAALQVPLAVLAGITAVYGAVALAGQTEMRRIGAYCAIVYAGLVTMAIATGTVAGGTAAVVLAVGRTLAMALFLVSVQTVHSRLLVFDVKEVRGLATGLPVIAALLVVSVAALCALPVLSVLPGLLLSFATTYAVPAVRGAAVAGAVGYAMMVALLARKTAQTCAGAPSSVLVSYLRHVADDPFDILIAGEHVAVDIDPADSPDVSSVFAGDLAGLADFDLDPERLPRVIPIDQLRANQAPAGAAHIASPSAVEEIDVFAELSGVADLMGGGPDAQMETEWDEAERFFSEAPSHDSWDDWDDEDDWGEDGGEEEEVDEEDFTLDDLMGVVVQFETEAAEAEEELEAPQPAKAAGPSSASWGKSLEKLSPFLDEQSMVVDVTSSNIRRMPSATGVGKTVPVTDRAAFDRMLDDFSAPQSEEGAGGLGGLDARGDEAGGVARRRPSLRSRIAMAGRTRPRAYSPDEPAAHEIYPDRTGDVTFKRSTLMTSEFAAAVLLIAVMAVLGLSVSELCDLVAPTLESLYTALGIL